MTKVGIIGCGKILERHVEAIESNAGFILSALCDNDSKVLERESKRLNIPGYLDYKEMINNENLDLVVIATPNSSHYTQSKHCLENNCDILVEKPVTIDPVLSRDLSITAAKNGKQAYSVLQVRLNPVVKAIKKLIKYNLIGEIRGVNLIQRRQRPPEYFSDWRGDKALGGGTLHECGIHYLDILCFLFGKPTASSASVYNTKHKDVEIEDTIYSILDFGNFGGNLEVTISSEPKNIECSISIITDKCYIKLGGKSLDKIVQAEFLEKEVKLKEEYDNIISNLNDALKPNSYGAYAGSCPNHPELYAKMSEFKLPICYDSLDLIKDIYQKAGVNYSE